MSTAVNLNVTMVSFGCCWSCGVPVYGPSAKYDKCKNDGNSFFCINGHSAVFRESEVSVLQKKLERAQKEKEWAEQGAKQAREAENTARRAEAIVRGKFKAQKERISNGVCPCCNRTFQNLQRHMKSKHPGFKESEDT